MKLRIILFFACFIYVLQASAQSEDVTFFPEKSISLRSNIAFWMIATPNVGVEYKLTERVGIIVDGAYAPWSWKSDREKKYSRLWNLSPQVRYYALTDKSTYLGLQGNIGEYNLWKEQGNHNGISIALGHQFPLSNNLLFDMGFSLGYLHRYNIEKYEWNGSENKLTSREKSKNYFGPTALSLSLVWKINK